MIVTTYPQLKSALQAISFADVVAFDTETDGLNTRKNKVIGLGVHTGLSGFYFVDPSHIKQAALALHKKRLVGWNSYFDLEMIRNNYGVDLWGSLHCDVLMLKHTCDEEYPFALKDVAAKYIGYWVKAEQSDLNASIKANGGKKGEVWKGDTAVVGRYCIQDCKLTRDLYLLFSKQLKSEGLEKFFYSDEVMPLYKEVTRHLQATGLAVDLKSAATAEADISIDIAKLEFEIMGKIKPLTDQLRQAYLDKEFPIKASGKFAQECLRMSGIPTTVTKTGKLSMTRTFLNAHAGNPFIDFLLGTAPLLPGIAALIQNNLYEQEDSPPTFNLNSKHQLKALFFDVMGETPLSYTDTGAPQADDDFLDSIASKYDWIPTLQDYNKLNKLKSAYIERILDHHENGTYYPQFKQHGTVSGRYGGDLMQLPRTAEDGQFSPIVTKYRNLIRTLFIARENHAFIDADYESLEPHVFAHVSKEQGIIDIFERNDDFYSTIAISTEGLKGISASKKADNYLGKVDKARRQKAKAYSLGIPYGMEDYALHKNIGVSQKEAASLIKGYLTAFPRLAAWMDHSNTTALEAGKITTESGRVRRFPQLEKIQETWDIKLLQNSLDLWHAHHEDEEKYAKAKKARGELKNCLNNAKNFQIQGLSASIMNRAAIKLNRALAENKLDAKIILQVHDQLVVECKKSDATLVQSITQKVMEGMAEEFKLLVKLKAPAQIGTNLADAH